MTQPLSQRARQEKIASTWSGEAVAFTEWEGTGTLSWGRGEVISFIILNAYEYLQEMVKPTPLCNCNYLQHSYFPTDVTGNVFNSATIS